MSNKVSSCFGAAPIGASEDMQRCPECKESCDYFEYDENGNPIEESNSVELLTVEIDRELWYYLLKKCTKSLRHLIENVDYKIKKVEVKDDFFKDDPAYHSLKKASNEAYKRLKEYEFKQRHK